MDPMHNAKLLSLHATTEDFISSTYVITIDKINSRGNGKWNNSETLRVFLAKDHCELIEDAVNDDRLAFKVYCNVSDPSVLLKHTLHEYLYKLYDPETIHTEQNQLIRKPHYYGTTAILDYAIRYERGDIPNDYTKNKIKIPREDVYTKIKSLNFFETSAPWGLDRVDQRTGTLDSTYQYINKADDIDIYIIDSGIKVTHTEFEGRATFLINTVGDGINSDTLGHGTFVASETCGATFGIAKDAHVYAAKVLDSFGDGDLFTIQAGIMEVIAHSGTNTSRRGVINLSLGGSKSTLLDNAVALLVANNLVTIVSAGNSASDACNYSPANLGGSTTTSVISVGASDINDNRPTFSNFGSCVSISAPGYQIAGAWPTSDTATHVLSGTSMAAPLVTGVAAIVLQQNLDLTVAEVKNLILAWATPSIVDYTSSTGGGKNLLYSLIVADSPLPTTPPTNTPPPTFIPINDSAAGKETISLLLLAFTSLFLLL